MKLSSKSQRIDLSITGVIITLGIVFGDLGTSPLYVMKAIVRGSGGHIDPDFIIGAVSCIIWTLTLQTTIKYVYIIMRADNKGEGGILALYALVRKRKSWLYLVAIIGGSALLADGVITPSITIVSAVEGLQLSLPFIKIIPVAIAIITFLFLIQQFGTSAIGKSFGPIMLVWFLTLGALGMAYLIKVPAMLKAFNPYYAGQLLFHHPHGFILLGAIFLCTTGAEALYSDLGHCGYKNIRISWLFVKVNLIITYLGQGAWILLQSTPPSQMPNPFFGIMPHWFLPFGVTISTLAAVIASQALISGSYTIISEAIQLNFWPKARISYPTTKKGQLYITSINWLLFALCVIVVLMFQSSSNMEAAYGLAITITMLMTTILMFYYLQKRRFSPVLQYIFLVIYLVIEITFLGANLFKFTHGGWFTLLLAGFIGTAMYVWYQARDIKNSFTRFIKINDIAEMLTDLSKDHSISKYATNLVYITRANYLTDVEAKIVYSIFNKKPKRADMYWLLHVDITDEPHTMQYSVENLIPGVLIKVEFKLGFKVQPRVNLFFKHVLAEMVRNKEIDIHSNYLSLKKHGIPADFLFIMIRRIQNYDIDFPARKQFIMDVYTVLRRLGMTDVRAYGLDTTNIQVEMVPFVSEIDKKIELTRIQR